MIQGVLLCQRILYVVWRSRKNSFAAPVKVRVVRPFVKSEMKTDLLQASRGEKVNYTKGDGP